MLFTTSTLISAALLAASQVGAVTQTVQVGQGGRVFSPTNVTAAMGDVIQFQFVAGNHTATQSTFANPCAQLVNTTTNTVGFDSGYVPGNAASPQTFAVTVNTTAPIWVYCRQTGHCQAGMVFSVNAPATGNTFDAFKSKATSAAAGTSSGAGAPSGGGTGGGSGSAGATGTSGGEGASGASGATGASGAIPSASGTGTPSSASSTTRLSVIVGALGVIGGAVSMLL